MLAWVGVGLTMVGLFGYFAMLGAHRFTYRTWVFDAVVGAGVLVGAVGGLREGSWTPAVWAVVGAVVWFSVSRYELVIPTAVDERPAIGDALPAFDVVTVDGDRFTDRDLVAAAPAVLTLYRGWWCPASRIQVDGLMADLARLQDRGHRVYAMSVDDPADSGWLQAYVGDAAVVLCGADTAVLDAFGARDARGVRWYTQKLDGEPAHDIARPTTFVVDEGGVIAHVHRSARIDERSGLGGILGEAAAT